MVRTRINDKIRKVNTERVLFKRGIVDKENSSKKNLYKNVINKCCMPGCRYGYILNTHHIIPIKNGGTDTFNNYIILCQYCHTHSKLHSRIEENRITILVYKFMIEQEILGFGICSDNYSDEEFQKVLRNHLYKTEHKIMTLEEEKEDEIIDNIKRCTICKKPLTKTRIREEFFVCKKCDENDSI